LSSNDSVVIKNIYHMLAYAFRSLKIGGISEFGAESFENLNELFAEIIVQGMKRQLKRGLPRSYIHEHDELKNLRGKINFQESLRKQSHVRHGLVCEFDEFLEDTPGNQIIKGAVVNLLRQSNLSKNRRHYLKFIWSSLGSVSDVKPLNLNCRISGDSDYVTLVNICQFFLRGLLINSEGNTKMREWLRDEEMSVLYEHFLLAYFRRHHSSLNAKAARINWDMQEFSYHMPAMKSDVYLSYEDKILIIDAKYYTKTMSDNFGKKTYHSNNLYQIYTYVKNADLNKNGNVSGMLLYAKTDEEITPDIDTLIGGNKISVKTLDLAQSFDHIKAQLDVIAESLYY